MLLDLVIIQAYYMTNESGKILYDMLQNKSLSKHVI